MFKNRLELVKQLIANNASYLNLKCKYR